MPWQSEVREVWLTVGQLMQDVDHSHRRLDRVEQELQDIRQRREVPRPRLTALKCISGVTLVLSSLKELLVAAKDVLVAFKEFVVPVLMILAFLRGITSPEDTKQLLYTLIGVK